MVVRILCHRVGFHWRRFGWCWSTKGMSFSSSLSLSQKTSRIQSNSNSKTRNVPRHMSLSLVPIDVWVGYVLLVKFRDVMYFRVDYFYFCIFYLNNRHAFRNYVLNVCVHCVCRDISLWLKFVICMLNSCVLYAITWSKSWCS